jgi:hypothetical protein
MLHSKTGGSLCDVVSCNHASSVQEGLTAIASTSISSPGNASAFTTTVRARGRTVAEDFGSKRQHVHEMMGLDLINANVSLCAGRGNPTRNHRKPEAVPWYAQLMMGA